MIVPELLAALLPIFCSPSGAMVFELFLALSTQFFDSQAANLLQNHFPSLSGHSIARLSCFRMRQMEECICLELGTRSLRRRISSGIRCLDGSTAVHEVEQ